MFVIYANDNYIFQHSKASATHVKLSNQAKQVNQADLATHDNVDDGFDHHLRGGDDEVGI